MKKPKTVFHLKVPPLTEEDRVEECIPLKMVYWTFLGRAYSTAFTELIQKYHFHN